MANRATIKYNGNTITEDREGGFVVNYNGSNLTTVSAGETRTFKCKDRYMKSVFKVGGRTLKCLDKLMATDVVVSVVSLFPSAPSSYSNIANYVEGGVFTWTAPSTGYFQIEVQGASGSGGNASDKNYTGGGGGGGGGCAISRVKLNKGNTITLYVSYTGYTNYAVINSSVESYANPTVTSGSVGGDAGSSPGEGGAGGVASGGNYANYNGGAGGKGGTSNFLTGGVGGNGGSPGYTGGRYGGAGGKSKGQATGAGLSPTTGSTGFIKIYAGNTNTA